ncbi:MAG: O-antigen ligase family protein [Elusimicrobiota bacterium]
MLIYTAAVLLTTGNYVFLGGHYLALTAVLFALGIVSGRSTENFKLKLMSTALVLLGIITFFALAQKLGLPDFSFRFSNTKIPYTSLGNRNYTADLIILLFPFLIAAFEQISRKYLWGFVPVLSALVFTRSLRGAAGLGAVLLFYFIFSGGKFKKVYGAIFILFLCGVSIFSFKNRDRIVRVNLKPRFLMWRVAKNMAFDSPVLGQGLGTFEYYYPKYQEEFFKDKDERIDKYKNLAQNPQRANNEYLHIFAETGIIGLLLFVIIFGLWFKKLDLEDRKVSLPAGAGAAGILVSGLVGFPFHRPSIIFLLAIIMGLTVQPAHGEKKLIKRNKIYDYTVIILVLFLAAAFSFCQIFWEDARREFTERSYGPALEKSKKALTFSFIPGKIYFLRGRIFYREGKYFNAIESYDKAAASYAHRSLYFNRGLAYLKISRPDRAKKDMERAFYTTPNFKPAADILGKIYKIEQENFKENENRNLRIEKSGD